MLNIRRLNMDSSWQITWDNTSMLIDPWLFDSEIDGAFWFNEQWHATPPLPLEDLEKYDSILISQPYSDHCHEPTLNALDTVPFFVTPKAKKRLSKAFPQREIQVLPNLSKDNWLAINNLDIAYFASNDKSTSLYDAILFRQGDEIVFYSPHGLKLTEKQLKILQAYKIKLLITSFSLFKMPFFLGGAVNPGKENALKLVEKLNPEKVLQTHDEDKHAKGLVKKIAKVVYPKVEELQNDMKGRFIDAREDYEMISI